MLKDSVVTLSIDASVPRHALLKVDAATVPDAIGVLALGLVVI
jgi:hypothetical protein